MASLLAADIIEESLAEVGEEEQAAQQEIAQRAQQTRIDDIIYNAGRSRGRDVVYNPEEENYNYEYQNEERYIGREENVMHNIRLKDRLINDMQQQILERGHYDRVIHANLRRIELGEQGYTKEQVDRMVKDFKESKNKFFGDEFQRVHYSSPKDNLNEMKDEALRKYYEKENYDPGLINTIIKQNAERRAIIQSYGFQEEDYEFLEMYYPDNIPEQLEEDLEKLEEKQRDETLPKSLEAERTGILKPKRVTFEEINSDGFQSEFRRSRDFSRTRSTRSESTFRSDRTPKGAIREALGGNAVEDLFYTDYAASKTGQGLDQIFSEIKNIYGERRNNIEISRHGKQVDRNRRVLGVVFKGESRDNLIANNKIPSYYSTSNIKKLLRNGIMPFGWNEEMAVQQGFGEDISKINFKEKTKDQSHEFLHRETTKAHIKATEGDLKNLRNRLKTRKLVQYYSQF